jgi:hypothetical protein
MFKIFERVIEIYDKLYSPIVALTKNILSMAELIGCGDQAASQYPWPVNWSFDPPIVRSTTDLTAGLLAAQRKQF